MLCFAFWREKNAGGLLIDDEAVMKDQMEDAGTASVGETGSVSSPALASDPVVWGKGGRVLLRLGGSPSPWTMASVPTSIESAYSP